MAASVTQGLDLAASVGVLRRNATFSALSEDHCARIVTGGPIDHARAGTELIRQGDIGRFAFLVLVGEVRIEVETESGRVPVARLGAGNLVGEIGAFAATPRTASVISETDVVLLRIEQATIHGLIAETPGAAVAVIGELGARLQGLNGTIAALTQAAHALARDEFQPGMLDMLRRQADRFSQFADVFDEMALELRRKRMLGQEMAAAEQIQMALLPDGIDAGPLAESFEISASMTPAKHVGGDFYDFFMLDDETLALAIGDVSGKGVPAAIFMSVCRTTLRSVARQGLSPGRTLAEVNRQLAEGNRESMFVTMAYARLNLRSGAFTCASGGHEEVFLLRPGTGAEQVPPTGPALGLFDGAEFGEIHSTLAPWDHVILGTDGITEAFNAAGEVFGRERFVAALEANSDQPAEAMVTNVARTIAAFVADHPPSDDLTGLAMRYLGAK